MNPSPNLPHLTREASPRLMVDGKPFMILGGELGNSTASSPDALAAAWPKARALNLNTVLAPVYWELIEPDEGQFDFSSLDALIAGAREHGQRLVLLWFGVWKNSMSTYVPAWVKQDGRRFPHARDEQGNAVEILSAFSPETLAADVAAYSAMMRHLHSVDGDRHTVLMVQIENEIGFLPNAREYGEQADAAFAEPVPADLAAALNKTPGTWAEVFSPGDAGEEAFMAWHYGRFVDALAKAGKAVYPLPVYVNAALNRPGRRPGEYPSAGPLPHLLDVWRAAAPTLDMLSPDIYFYDFAHWAGQYRRPGNAVFVPEAMRSVRAAANALYAIGQLGAIGFSPFGIESADGPAAELLCKTYSALRHLWPRLLADDARTFGLSPTVHADGTVDPTPQIVRFGDYTLEVRFADTGAANVSQDPVGDPALRGAMLPPSGGLIVVDGPDAYTVVGTGLRVLHTHASGDRVGLLNVREYAPRDGDWQPARWLNGDQTHQGREVQLHGFGLQAVRLYRYR